MLSTCKSELYTSNLSEIFKHLRRTYHNMMSRCYREYAASYDSHGGKNIGVCDEWRNSFDAFVTWSLDHGYHKSLTLDRIDNSRDYGPDNCRYVTSADQNRNKTNSVIEVYHGDRVPVSAVCAERDISLKTMYKRLKNGMEFEDAIDLPDNATNEEEQHYKDICDMARMHNRAFIVNKMRKQHEIALLMQ